MEGQWGAAHDTSVAWQNQGYVADATAHQAARYCCSPYRSQHKRATSDTEH